MWEIGGCDFYWVQFRKMSFEEMVIVFIGFFGFVWRQLVSVGFIFESFQDEICSYLLVQGLRGKK